MSEIWRYSSYWSKRTQSHVFPCPAFFLIYYLHIWGHFVFLKVLKWPLGVSGRLWGLISAVNGCIVEWGLGGLASQHAEKLEVNFDSRSFIMTMWELYKTISWTWASGHLSPGVLIEGQRQGCVWSSVSCHLLNLGWSLWSLGGPVIVRNAQKRSALHHLLHLCEIKSLVFFSWEIFPMDPPPDPAGKLCPLLKRILNHSSISRGQNLCLDTVTLQGAASLLKGAGWLRHLCIHVSVLRGSCCPHEL